MGRIVRAEHELCLVGTRGRPVTRRKNLRSTFEATVGEHSAKPDCLYDLVESLREGPFVELFARPASGGLDESRRPDPGDRGRTRAWAVVNVEDLGERGRR